MTWNFFANLGDVKWTGFQLEVAGSSKTSNIAVRSEKSKQFLFLSDHIEDDRLFPTSRKKRKSQKQIFIWRQWKLEMNMNANLKDVKRPKLHPPSLLRAVHLGALDDDRAGG